MSELPSGWIETTLAEINIHKSKSLDPTSFADETFELYSVPSFPSDKPETLKGIQIGSSKQVVKPNDVLICKINPRINRVWLVKPQGDCRQIASSEWIIARVPEVHSGYLRYYFSSPTVRERIVLDISGVGGSLMRAQPKRVAEYPVPIAPLNDQKRITKKLDSLLTRVDSCQSHLEGVPQILKRFRQSVLAAATSGRLTADWRDEKEVDGEWEETTVGEIAEVFLGRQRSPENHFGEHMRKYVRAANITWNGWDFSDVKEMNFNPRDFERYHLQVGDVLLNEGSGSADEVGKPAIWNGEIEDCCFQNTLLCVRPYSASSKYLYYLFLYTAMAKLFVKNVRGVNIFHIGKEKLANFEISIPSLEEQSEIVCRVEKLFAYADRLEARYWSAIERVALLTPSLLAKAFRGELVEQDPDDEPASVLLERIKKAREEYGDSNG